jgi:thiol-disulfide isomerase/thioredoxin
MKTLALFLLATSLALANLVTDVREAIGARDFERAEGYIQSYRAVSGATPEMILSVSWMARGWLALKNYDQAAKFAAETYRLAVAELKKRPLDREGDLPLALGAAIEVNGNVMAARGRRSEAVVYLKDQLRLYRATSIATRIQKNINLLSLEGKPAPALEKVALPKGKPVLLFFWAHWCPDCKAEAPVLARIKAEYGPKGLQIVAPTQKYGYVAGGEDAPPEVELPYIEQVRQRYYSAIITTPAPVSEVNFQRYGASTTPTLVLVDRAGIVRSYHPGQMTYEELRARIESIL